MKKLLIGAAMLAAVFAFTGCNPEDLDGAIKGDNVNFDNSYIKEVKETDENDKEITVIEQAKKTDKDAKENTEYYYRAVKTLATKHYGATCILTLDPQGNDDGNIGFMFDRTENEDGTINFGVVTVNYNSSDFRYYISFYKNVLLEENSYTTESNFTDIDGNKIVAVNSIAAFKSATGGAEYQVEPTKSSGKYFTSLDIDEDAEGKYAVKVQVVAKDDGSYDVKFFKADDDTETASPLVSKLISNELTGLTEKTQTKFGRYAMIKAGQTLKASFEFEDYEGNPIPVDYE